MDGALLVLLLSGGVLGLIDLVADCIDGSSNTGSGRGLRVLGGGLVCLITTKIINLYSNIYNNNVIFICNIVEIELFEYLPGVAAQLSDLLTGGHGSLLDVLHYVCLIC